MNIITQPGDAGNPNPGGAGAEAGHVGAGETWWLWAIFEFIHNEGQHHQPITTTASIFYSI